MKPDLPHVRGHTGAERMYNGVRQVFSLSEANSPSVEGEVKSGGMLHRNAQKITTVLETNDPVSSLLPGPSMPLAHIHPIAASSSGAPH